MRLKFNHSLALLFWCALNRINTNICTIQTTFGTATHQRTDEHTNTQLSIFVEQCFCLHFVMMLKMESMLTNEFNIDEIQRARIDGYLEWNRKEYIIIKMHSDRFSAQLNRVLAKYSGKCESSQQYWTQYTVVCVNGSPIMWIFKLKFNGKKREKNETQMNWHEKQPIQSCNCVFFNESYFGAILTRLYKAKRLPRILRLLTNAPLERLIPLFTFTHSFYLLSPSRARIRFYCLFREFQNFQMKITQKWNFN